MKTSENLVDKNLSPTIGHELQEMKNKARPLRSLRPMKSMVRVKSFKPQRIELSKTRRRVVKL